ncbi:MAG: 30S ribosomal protein S6 [Rickettsiales bacterium]|nr:30S ribosomal protein S6 [Rickettsiales bacterium]
MALYETTFIIRPELAQADVEKVVASFEEVITSAGDKLIKKEFWGLRDLAYKIKKSKKGHYVHFGFEAKASTISELRRRLGISEDIIRDLTIKVEKISNDNTNLNSED